MKSPLRFKRLSTSNRVVVTPRDGEPLWDLTRKELFVGDGVTSGGVPTYNLSFVGPVVDAGAGNYNPSTLTPDYIITVNNTAASRSIIISTEDVASGSSTRPRIFIIKDQYGQASVNNITVTLENGGTIDGSASVALTGAYDSITLYCTGTNAFII